MKLQLVEGWRSAWRWWSMQAHFIMTALGGLFVLMPGMPQEVQQLIPLEYRAAAVALWLVLGGLLRVVQQKPSAPRYNDPTEAGKVNPPQNSPQQLPPGF